MKTQQEVINAFEEASDRLERHGIAIHSNGHFLFKSDGKTVGAADTVDGLAAFADALDFAAARDRALNGRGRPVETHSDICALYAEVLPRLERRGLTVDVNGSFLIFVGEYAEGDMPIGVPKTVDGLKAFADALDFADSRGPAAER